MIQPERVCDLNAKPVRKGGYALYWMQAAQRAKCNHALQWAIRRADELKQPVLTVFGLMDDYPEANERHYAFMLEGLSQTRQALRQQGIQLVVRHMPPARAALDLAGDASLIVTDRGYTRHQKAWRRDVARQAPCRVVQVETDVVVPVEAASDKQEYSAATLRPKLHRRLGRYLVPLDETKPRGDSLDMHIEDLSLAEIDTVLADLKIDRSAGRVTSFIGGTSNATRLLRDFIRNRLQYYAGQRNDPSLDIQSHQSPYLHFGQISPLQIALEVSRAKGVPQVAKDAYLEELDRPTGAGDQLYALLSAI